MFKDHKEGKKTRPVVAGCNSNTRGFSISAFDLLESVNKANHAPYEAISSEDMLAKITRYQKKAEEILKEGKTHLQRKVMRSRGEGMKLVTRCDKVWIKKTEEISKREEERQEQNNKEEQTEDGISGTNSQEELRQEQQEDGCERDNNEETLKYRSTQYENNPNMSVTGEDIQVVLDCDHCGPDLTEEVRLDCEGCVDGWVREDYSLCIIGNDVVSLFPSLDSINTVKILHGGGC
jgi:hypothetical protein